MRYAAAWTSLVILLALGFVGAADDDKKPGKDKPETKDKLVPAGEVTGKLVRVEGSQKLLEIQINLPYFTGRSVGYRGVNVELQTSDDLKVRLPQPPIEFDAKGNPKKYSVKELKELRGPGNLPGFPGDFDSLKPEQYVKVVLKKVKDPPKVYGKKEKDADKEFPIENKPVVTMVIVLLEPRK
jgi:hypothetical protein